MKIYSLIPSPGELFFPNPFLIFLQQWRVGLDTFKFFKKRFEKLFYSNSSFLVKIKREKVIKRPKNYFLSTFENVNVFNHECFQKRFFRSSTRGRVSMDFFFLNVKGIKVSLTLVFSTT